MDNALDMMSEQDRKNFLQQRLLSLQGSTSSRYEKVLEENPVKQAQQKLEDMRIDSRSEMANGHHELIEGWTQLGKGHFSEVTISHCG